MVSWRAGIPERVVHAKGAGAHGYFESAAGANAYSKASVFAKAGKRTPVFARFSTVGGERGSADTARDPRGFSIKHYTEDGIWSDRARRRARCDDQSRINGQRATSDAQAAQGWLSVTPLSFAATAVAHFHSSVPLDLTVPSACTCTRLRDSQGHG